MPPYGHVALDLDLAMADVGEEQVRPTLGPVGVAVLAAEGHGSSVPLADDATWPWPTRGSSLSVVDMLHNVFHVVIALRGQTWAGLRLLNKWF